MAAGAEDSHRTIVCPARLAGPGSYRRLERVLEDCRILYNDGLAVKRMAYEWLGVTVRASRTTVVRDRSRVPLRRLGAGRWSVDDDQSESEHSPPTPPPVTADPPDTKESADALRLRLADQLTAAGASDEDIVRAVGRGLRWVRSHRGQGDGRLAWTQEAVRTFVAGEPVHPVPGRPWPVRPIDLASCYYGRRGGLNPVPEPLNLSRWLTELQAWDEPELADIERYLKMDVLNRLDRAFSDFFRRAAQPDRSTGYPRPLAPGGFSTLSLEVGEAALSKLKAMDLHPDRNGKGGRGRVYVKGLPRIDFRYDRPLPTGRLVTLRVHREPRGQVLVMLVYRLEPNARRPQAGGWQPSRPVGVHLGLSTAGALSMAEADGVMFNRHERRPADDSAGLERTLRRYRRATGPARAAARRAVARQHRRIRCLTRDWQHRLTARLVQGHDFIAVDAVNLDRWGEDRPPELRRALHDAGLGGVRQLLDYKGTAAGVPVVAVELLYSDRICSRCGNINAETGSAPSPLYRCASCSYMTRADENSTLNIMNAGLQKFQREAAERQLDRFGG